MPTGKAPIFGWVAWPKRAPEGFDPVPSLLKWQKPSKPRPSAAEVERLRNEITSLLARYFGSLDTTPILTETERVRAVKRAKRALRKGDNRELSNLDVNTRAILYRDRNGKRWPHPLLVKPVQELAEIWENATGRSPRTIDPGPQGEYPFYDFIVDLFEAWKKEPPSRGSIIDIVARPPD